MPGSRLMSPCSSALLLVLLLVGALPACGPEGGRATAPGAGDQPAGADAAPPRRPHVVLYVIDTLRADRLGLYGYGGNTSPFLDTLAGESAVFDQAQAAAPWTLPSCVSLQTSSFPMNHGVVSARHSTPEQLTTITEFMQAQGYFTAGFIQNLLGGSQAGLDQGYDHLFEKPQAKDLTAEDRAAGLAGLRPFFEWLREQDGSRPLYTYIHTIEPHHPYDGHPALGPPVSTADKQRLNRQPSVHRGLQGQLDPAHPDADTVARIAEVEAELRAELPVIHRLYDGDVRTADDNLAKVVAALKQQGLWDDTVFIVLSDHGEEFLEHGNWFHDQSLYAEVIHVPLIMRVPGLTDGGRRVSAPVSLVDVAPTLADLLGAAPDPLWLGRSLLPALGGEALAPGPTFSQRVNLDRKVASTKAARGDRETAVLDGDAKAILHHEVDGLSLFDHAADPDEQHELSAADPATAARLAGIIEAWGRDQARRPFPRTLEKQLDGELLELLRELGYVDADAAPPR